MYELLLLEPSTGLRRGEVWELVVSQPKTKASKRSVVLPAAVLGALKTFKKAATSRWMFPSPIKEDSPQDPAAVRKKLSSILKQAEFKHIRFHDLRHTLATASLEHGMDVKTLSTIIGQLNQKEKAG